MKNQTSLILLAALMALPFAMHSQQCPTAKGFKKGGLTGVSEFSIGLGASHYFGDLALINRSDRRLTGELHKEQINALVNLNYRYYFSRFANLRMNFLYTRLTGSDRHNEVEDHFSTAWFRQYRNLTFRTEVFEFSAMMEVNIAGFVPGNFKRIISPYIIAGAGFIYFDPKAPYNENWINMQNGEGSLAFKKEELYNYDSWVRLQPLGTEGQGMPGYAKKYSLVQPVLIAGVGLKYNVSAALSVSLEVAHRFTFTDYLDDVSTVYPDPREYYALYDKDKANMAAHMSVRSKEIDPSSDYGYITSKGQQRGNPARKDSYLTSVFSVGYNITAKMKNLKPGKDKKEKEEDVRHLNSPQKTVWNNKKT